jgi:lysophospholipase L1-like esterase
MLRKLALALASALAALGIAEAVVRAGGLGVHDHMYELRKYGFFLVPDEGGYMRHPAGARTVLRGVSLQFNSLGMRDDEPRVPKPPGVFRILCVGDSVTLGPAVPQDAIYSARLRALLSREDVDVVTAGVAGWNTIAEERFLQRHLAQLAPDLVLLLYVTNDNELGEAYVVTHATDLGWSTRLYQGLVLHSQLFEWTAFVYETRIAPDLTALGRLQAWQRQQQAATGGAPFTARDQGWLESRAALQRILDLARAHGARMAIFLHNQVNRQIERDALARLREFGAENGVPVFDTSPFFAGHRPVTLMNDGFRDPHPNASGHALLAEGIARTLEAEGLLRGEPPR